MFFSFQCFLYSTHKSTPEKPRLRLIIPLSREVTPDEYMAVARKIAEDVGMELFDDTTYEPSRLMYWPSTSADGEFIYREIKGSPLDPDAVLARYTDWRNSAEWPVSKRQEKIVQREIKKQADPLQKPGLVGAFCRAYSIEDAIDTFIPDVYKHSAIHERFSVRDIDTPKDIEDWNAGKIPVALIHPASAGHGLNLQSGGSTLVWFSMTWSLELYQQLNDRLWRQGQEHTVVVHHILTKGTIDEDIIRALERKDVSQSVLVAAVRARIGG